MSETLTDIEVLTLRCRSEQSKSYIAEAVLCYRSGAYRAAIVSAWIAVVFDLVDKLRELTLAGDGNATPIWQRYERYIQQMEQGNNQAVQSALEFERELIHICRTQLQFFDQQQIVDLERLREDRHRCAHPSFQRIGEPYRPSAEQARLHLVNSVSHVLSQPPVQGRALIDRLLLTVGSTYFPLDTTQAVTQLRATAFGRANDALINGFVDRVVFDYFKPDENLYHKPQAVYALNAALEMYRPQVEARLAKQFNRVIQDANDLELGFAVIFVTGVENTWGLLLEPARQRIHHFITTTPAVLLMPSLKVIAKVDALRPSVEAKIAALSTAELSMGITSFGLADLAKTRALQLVSQVGSFNAANEAITNLIFPIFDQLTKEDFVTLIGYPRTTGADLIGAHAFSSLITRLRATNLFVPGELDHLLTASGAGILVPPPPQPN
jgi:hypothetical protein